MKINIYKIFFCNNIKIIILIKNWGMLIIISILDIL